VDEVFQAVNGGDFAFAAFVGASDNGDFVVFADGDGADLKHAEDLYEILLPSPELWRMGYPYIVLFFQFFAERSAHDCSSNTGGGAEMKFARLAPR
jgi:hypothetical protein